MHFLANVHRLPRIDLRPSFGACVYFSLINSSSATRLAPIELPAPSEMATQARMTAPLRTITRPSVLRRTRQLGASRSIASIAFPWSAPSIPSSFTVPLSQLNGPLQKLGGLLAALWEGILRAVPKKKPPKAQSKKRRNHGGRATKDYKNFVNCPSCGRPKRAHILCQYCVQSTSLFAYCCGILTETDFHG